VSMHHVIATRPVLISGRFDYDLWTPATGSGGRNEPTREWKTNTESLGRRRELQHVQVLSFSRSIACGKMVMLFSQF
jgi:hypothetical protein